MVARTAGGDVHRFDSFENIRGGGAERGLEQPGAGYALLQGLRNGARLLVNLLEHEMPVLASFHRVGRQLAFHHGPRYHLSRRVSDGDRFAPDLRNVAFLEKHEAPRDRQQGGDVGGHEVLIDPQAHHHRTTLARQDDGVGIALRDHGQRVGPVQFRHGFAHGLVQARGTRSRQVMMDAMGDDFGIGLGAELISEIDESGAQRLVILDDAVVHDGDSVPRDVRMSVSGGGNAVSRPARVCDADMPRDRVGIQGFLENLDLPQGTAACQPLIGTQNRDARRIVAPIFEASQSLHEDGHGIALRDHADDSAHTPSSARGSKRAPSVPQRG